MTSIHQPQLSYVLGAVLAAQLDCKQTGAPIVVAPAAPIETPLVFDSIAKSAGIAYDYD